MGSICSKKFWRAKNRTRRIKNPTLNSGSKGPDRLTLKEIKDYFSQLILGLDYRKPV